MATDEQAVVIHSEAHAWQLLGRLIRDEVDPTSIDLGIGSFAWSKLSIHVDGEDFHGSIPASFMRGLLEFQENFLRTSARITRDSSYISTLPNDSRAELDIVFQVADGSTTLSADLKEQLASLMPKALEKMTGREIAIVLIAAALIWGGKSTYQSHLETSVELARITADPDMRSREQDALAMLLESQKERDEILKDAIARIPRIGEIRSDGAAAKDAIVRNSSTVKRISIQGVELSSSDVSDLNRRSRRQAEEISERERLRVMSIDAAEAHHFKVRLRRGNGTEFTALIRDIPDNQRTISALWRSETSRKRIIVEYEGRQIGRVLKDARIRRAWTPRTAG